MEDVGKLIGAFFSLLIAIYVLSTIAKELPVEISGLQFGPLLVGVFIFMAIVWFIKEVLDR